MCGIHPVRRVLARLRDPTLPTSLNPHLESSTCGVAESVGVSSCSQELASTICRRTSGPRRNWHRWNELALIPGCPGFFGPVPQPVSMDQRKVAD